MTKTRKILVVILSAILALGLSMSVFAFTGCGGNGDLSSITLDTKEMKTVYVAGEKLNTAGLKVTAKYAGDKTKELKEKDYTIADVDKTLTVKNDFMSTNFQSTQSFTVSYTEKDVTKTRNFNVTVTNKLTKATIKTMPDKTEYFVGEQFDVKGLVINGTFQDGKTEEIKVTSENSTVKTEGALDKNAKSVIVSIGGQDVEIAVTMMNAIYVQAETGYRNGEPIEQSTGDSGSLRTDAMPENAQQSAQELYESHLRAQFALSKLSEDESFDADALAAQKATVDDLYEVFGGNKNVYNEDVTAGGEIISKLYIEIVKWLNDKDNEKAIEEYVESEEFEALVNAYIEGTNEDIADYNYEDSVEKYTASGEEGKEYYLGQNNRGDTISFIFDSTEATTGTIAFRMSSAYLYADDGWLSIIMGDVDFAELCEFYVNGVQQEIPEGTILYGGKTEDGSPNNVLWVNWANVTFDNVAFVEGRNAVELKILNHSIAAQENYSFAANIDTMLVSPSQDDEGEDTSELGLYNDEDIDITAEVTDVAVAAEDDKAIVTVIGTYEGTEIVGYVADILPKLFDIKVGNTRADIALEGKNFAATVDVTDFDFGDYNITVGGKKIVIDGITGSAKAGRNDYTLKADDKGNATINIDSTYKANVTSHDIVGATTQMTIENVDNKAVIKITGTMEFETAGYNMDDPDEKAEAAAAMAARLKTLYYFDLQENGGSWGYPIDKNFHTVTVDVDAKTFTICADVTTYPLDKNEGMIHCTKAKADGSFGSGGDLDYKPNIDTFSADVTIDGLKYTLTYDKSQCFGLPYLKVVDTAIPANTTNLDSATLSTEDNKIYMTVTGTMQNYTADSEAALKAAIIKDGYVDAENASDGSDKTVFGESAITYDIDYTNNTYTVKVDITSLNKTGTFWMHLGTATDVRNTNGTDAVVCGDYSYKFVVEPQNGWTAYRLQVTQATA